MKTWRSELCTKEYLSFFHECAGKFGPLSWILIRIFSHKIKEIKNSNTFIASMLSFETFWEQKQGYTSIKCHISEADSDTELIRIK